MCMPVQGGRCQPPHRDTFTCACLYKVVGVSLLIAIPLHVHACTRWSVSASSSRYLYMCMRVQGGRCQPPHRDTFTCACVYKVVGVSLLMAIPLHVHACTRWSVSASSWRYLYMCMR